MSDLLQITGLHAAYGKIVALKGVDLEVKSGEIVALIGSNGAGKSTLMMSVFGKPRAPRLPPAVSPSRADRTIAPRQAGSTSPGS